MLDWVIRGGTVIDGSGGAPFRADIGIRGGKIAAVGSCGEAAQTLDAAGRYVTPGFLDIHRHGDAAVFRPGFGRAELRQGLTSIVNGNCGLSLAPFGAAHRAELRPIWTHCAPGRCRCTSACSSAAGRCARTAAAMRRAMRMRPCRSCTAVWSVRWRTGPSASRSASAMRRSASTRRTACSGRWPRCRAAAFPSACTCARRATWSATPCASATASTARSSGRTPVHISHLKAMGPRNWNRRIPEALALLQQARDEGLDVSCDVYPYCAGSTQLLHLLPQDFLAGGTDAVAARLRDPAQRDILRERIAHGRDFDNIAQMVGWDNIRLTTLHRPEFQPLTGKTLAEAARLLGLEPVDCLCHVLAEEACNVTMIDFITCDEDIGRILRAPFASVISDSLYPTEGLPHPRVYGTFTRILETFVRERHVLTLPEAVQRMTALPAQALHLQGKGRIAAGMDAARSLYRHGKRAGAVRKICRATPRNCIFGLRRLFFADPSVRKV